MAWNDLAACTGRLLPAAPVALGDVAGLPEGAGVRLLGRLGRHDREARVLHLEDPDGGGAVPVDASAWPAAASCRPGSRYLVLGDVLGAGAPARVKARIVRYMDGVPAEVYREAQALHGGLRRLPAPPPAVAASRFHREHHTVSPVRLLGPGAVESKAEVLGTVVDLVKKEAYAAFSLDDGTGLLVCKLYFGERGVPPASVHAPDELQLGAVLRARGRVGRLRVGEEEKVQLLVTQLAAERHPAAEAGHWMRCYLALAEEMEAGGGADGR